MLLINWNNVFHMDCHCDAYHHHYVFCACFIDNETAFWDAALDAKAVLCQEGWVSTGFVQDELCRVTTSALCNKLLDE
jgi:hypothetical protein